MNKQKDRVPSWKSVVSPYRTDTGSAPGGAGILLDTLLGSQSNAIPQPLEACDKCSLKVRKVVLNKQVMKTNAEGRPSLRNDICAKSLEVQFRN